MNKRVPKKLTQKELFDKSLEQWGMSAQLSMMAEEAGELGVASLHMNRENKTNTVEKRRETLLEFAEELTDAQFMIEEMIYYFKKHVVNAEGTTFFDAMINFRKLKEQRLQELLGY